MKNYQISPGQIPHLVRLTADLFREMNKEITYSPNKGEKANHMHFVVGLLQDLVDTAYPMAENHGLENHLHIIDLTELADHNSIAEKISEIIYKAKDGEF